MTFVTLKSPVKFPDFVSKVSISVFGGRSDELPYSICVVCLNLLTNIKISRGQYRKIDVDIVDIFTKKKTKYVFQLLEIL